MQHLLHSVTHWCQSVETQLSRATLYLSMVMALIGFPMQIWQTIADGHCGLHIVLIIAPLFLFVARIPYSIGKEAWAILPADCIGLLSCIVLAYLYLHYNLGLL